MWLSSIFGIFNSHGDCASPWNTPLWIFLFSLAFPSISLSRFSHFFSIKLMASSDILHIMKQLCVTISKAFLLSVQDKAKFFHLVLLIIIHSLEVFTSALADGFSLESEWQQVASFSRTLLRILAVLNNTVVWMVSTRPPTSKSSSPFSNPLVTIPNAPITIDMIVTCMFHSFFNSLARSRYLSFVSHSFNFILWPGGIAKSTILQVLFFFLLIINKSGLLAGIRWSVCMFTPCECFQPVLATCLSMDYEWRSLWVPRTLLCSNLYVFDFFFDFQLFHSPFQCFGDCSKLVINN